MPPMYRHQSSCRNPFQLLQRGQHPTRFIIGQPKWMPHSRLEHESTLLRAPTLTLDKCSALCSRCGQKLGSRLLLLSWAIRYVRAIPGAIGLASLLSRLNLRRILPAIQVVACFQLIEVLPPSKSDAAVILQRVTTCSVLLLPARCGACLAMHPARYSFMFFGLRVIASLLRVLLLSFANRDQSLVSLDDLVIPLMRVDHRTLVTILMNLVILPMQDDAIFSSALSILVRHLFRDTKSIQLNQHARTRLLCRTNVVLFKPYWALCFRVKPNPTSREVGVMAGGFAQLKTSVFLSFSLRFSSDFMYVSVGCCVMN